MTETQLLMRRERYKTNHILHLLLSVLTGGLWLLVWALIAIRNAGQRGKIDRKLLKDKPLGGIEGWLERRKASK